MARPNNFHMPTLNILFSCDRRVLAGLHVAAFSVLNRASPLISNTCFYVLSDAINEQDMELLRKTLRNAGKPFTAELRKLDISLLSNFPRFQGTLAPYYRLLAPQYLDVERLIYLDVDTLCDLDLSGLVSADLGGHAAGLVPEAPLASCVDQGLMQQLGDRLEGHYFNAGMIVMDVNRWRRQQVTEQCLDYLAKNRTDHYDQTALNYVLRQDVAVLESKFNSRTNDRANWPALCRPLGQIQKLIHFIDFPKPWDPFARLCQAHAAVWRQVLHLTEMREDPGSGRSWFSRLPKSTAQWPHYRKSFKDALLFKAYSQGWLKRVKGVPVNKPSLKS